MGKYKKVLTIWLPLIVWAAIIFTFSNQPYEDQDIRPIINEYIDEEKAEELLSHINIEYANNRINVAEDGAAEVIEFLIRKGAHLFSYAFLGLLLLRALMSIKLPVYQGILYAFILGILFAASDEWHQSFTPNRTPLVSDVILDSFGVMIGIVNYIVFFKVFHQDKIEEL